MLPLALGENLIYGLRGIREVLSRLIEVGTKSSTTDPEDSSSGVFE